MSEELRVWEVVEGTGLKEVRRSRLDLEGRIEGWLETDVSLVSDDLLVIGRQVRTDFGGAVDVLCIDSAGDLTIIELKRDMAPRVVTAQILEYAAWAKDLTANRIVEVANNYLGGAGPLGDAFARKFGEELPENLNTTEANLLVIAGDIDERTEKVIRYLSDTYGVRVNAAIFNYFSDDGERELLTRSFLLEPEQVEDKTQNKAPSKRTPPPTIEELCSRAERKGYGEQFRAVLEAAQEHRLSPRRYPNSVMYGPRANRNRALFTVSVGSQAGEGATVKVSPGTWQDFYPVTEQEVRSILGHHARPTTLTPEEAERFTAGLDRLFGVIKAKTAEQQGSSPNDE